MQFILVRPIFTTGPKHEKALSGNRDSGKLPLQGPIIAITEVPAREVDFFICAVVELYPVFIVPILIGHDALTGGHILIDNDLGALSMWRYTGAFISMGR